MALASFVFSRREWRGALAPRPVTAPLDTLPDVGTSQFDVV